MLQLKDYQIAGIRVGEHSRILKSCPDLRMYVLNNEFATLNFFPEFINVALIQTKLSSGILAKLDTTCYLSF